MNTHLNSASSSGRTAPDRYWHDPVFESGLSAEEIITRLDLKSESRERAQLLEASGEFTLITRFFDQNLRSEFPERVINHLVIGGVASSIFDEPRHFDISVSTPLVDGINLNLTRLPVLP